VYGTFPPRQSQESLEAERGRAQPVGQRFDAELKLHPSLCPCRSTRPLHAGSRHRSVANPAKPEPSHYGRPGCSAFRRPWVAAPALADTAVPRRCTALPPRDRHSEDSDCGVRSYLPVNSYPSTQSSQASALAWCNRTVAQCSGIRAGEREGGLGGIVMRVAPARNSPAHGLTKRALGA
jgi:hypothetical protein